MKHTSLAIVSLSVMLAACSDNDSGNNATEDVVPDATSSEVDNNPATPPVTPPAAEQPDTTTPPIAETSARYRLTFNGSWSEQTHPTRFPGSSAHFSGLIGAVHNEQVIFWEPGQIATDGIELMAETGSKSLHQGEVDAAIAAGSAQSVISGGGIVVSPGTVSVEFEVTRDYPQVSIVSMIAPSPDWFVGVHNLSLLDANGFIPSMTVDLVAYDSGTDSGTLYTSGDSDTQPRDPVAGVSSQPADTSFVDGMPLAGQFVIERLVE